MTGDISPCRRLTRGIVFTTWLCAFGVTAALGESLYVTDQLMVGLHESANLDSAIVKVIQTGAELEVVERSGDLVRVRDGDNTEGWVDASYLVETAPAAAEAGALRARIKELEERFEARVSAAAAASGDTEIQLQIDALMKENASLKGKLSDERLRAGQLQADVSTLRAQTRQADTPADLAIAELEREKLALTEELEEAAEDIERYQAQIAQEDTSALLPLVLQAYGGWLALIIGLLLVGAFFGGAYVVDLLGRRRHGGFRV